MAFARGVQSSLASPSIERARRDGPDPSSAQTLRAKHGDASNYWPLLFKKFFMRSLKLLPIAAFSLLVSGCAFHRTPYKTYEGDPPLSSTSVFSSLDDKAQKFIEARITHVNGQETSCFQVGCPYWVRVLPGTNKFTVKYTSNYSMSAGLIRHSYAILDVEISDMKPGHVYVSRYREQPNRVAIRVEDIGDRPDYGIVLGLQGVNRQFYPLRWE